MEFDLLTTLELETFEERNLTTLDKHTKYQFGITTGPPEMSGETTLRSERSGHLRTPSPD